MRIILLHFILTCLLFPCKGQTPKGSSKCSCPSDYPVRQEIEYEEGRILILCSEGEAESGLGEYKVIDCEGNLISPELSGFTYHENIQINSSIAPLMITIGGIMANESSKDVLMQKYVYENGKFVVRTHFIYEPDTFTQMQIAEFKRYFENVKKYKDKNEKVPYDESFYKYLMMIFDAALESKSGVNMFENYGNWFETGGEVGEAYEVLKDYAKYATSMGILKKSPKNIADYFQILPNRYRTGYNLVEQNGKYYTISTCCLGEFGVEVDKQNGYLLIDEVAGTGGGRQGVTAAIFQKGDGNKLVGVTTFAGVVIPYEEFSYETKFLQYLNDQWYDVTKEVIPALTHKDFLNPISNIDKDEFSIEYTLPKVGTTIKVRLHITGDNESPEKIKISNSLRFNTIELNWDKVMGRFVVGKSYKE